MRTIGSLLTMILAAAMTCASAPHRAAAQAPASSLKTAPATLPTVSGTGTSPAMQADPAAVAAARANFDKVFGEWKQLLSQLRELRQQYSAEDGLKGEDRNEIEARYYQLTKDADALLPKLVDAAVESYRAQAGKDNSLAQFLVEVAHDEFRRDNYEIASRAASALVDHGVRSQYLFEMAGKSAFHVNDFDAAEKYLTQAVKAAPPSDARQFLPLIARQKQEWLREQKLRAAEAKADDLPRVKIETRYGDIVIELFENEAPNSVANFISLVEKGFYDGVPFHRVLPGFMGQTGLKENGIGYTIHGEVGDEKKYRRHFRGSLSMALKEKQPDSGNSEFFIAFVPTHWLDGQHTVFGRVIEGMNILSRIQRRDPEKNPPFPGDPIIKATVIRKRNHKYEPQTLAVPEQRPTP